MIISFGDIPKIRAQYVGKRIVFVSGSFDITHAGHVLFFEDAKRHGDILVVLVGNDTVVRQNKGPHRPIFNEHLRMKMIDSLKPVDYVILDNISDEIGHPLDGVERVLADLRPDAYVVNDDAFDIPYREKIAKKHGVKLIKLSRAAPPEFEGISASSIIKKIKQL
jgi:cytidyltransferase-like protein